MSNGQIKPGDTVKTLHLTKTLYGRVLSVNKTWAIVEGRTQPGAQTRRISTSVENLDHVSESELAGEDRKAKVFK